MSFHVNLGEGICYMAGCQNYGPLLGPLTTRCRLIIGPKKGTIVLTTTHIVFVCPLGARLLASLGS